MSSRSTAEYFAARSAKRMQTAHEAADGAMAMINASADRSLKRLKGEVRKLLSSIDGMSPAEVRRWLDVGIPYEDYEKWLTLYRAVQDSRVRAKVKARLKVAAMQERVRRKEALIEAIERERYATIDTQSRIATKHLSRVYKKVLDDLGAPRPNVARVNEIIRHEWKGSNYSKRIWKNAEAMSELLESAILDGALSGRSYQNIAKDISDTMDASRFAANRLIRTETSYVVNSAELDDAIRRGVRARRYTAHLDSRTSKICREHDGRVYRIEDIRVGENAPPLHPFCRSFMVDLLEDWDYETEDELEQLIGDGVGDNSVSIEIDEFTPCLRRLSDNAIVQTTVAPLNRKDIPKGWLFDWSRMPEGCTIYALRADGDDRIQGLVATTQDFVNKAVKIQLIESAPHNIGYNKNEKEYMGVGGHLFAEAIRQSFESDFGGVVYFDAKTGLISYYKKEFNAEQVGSSQRLIIQGMDALKLYNQYYGGGKR